jgi:hypothetical protein
MPAEECWSLSGKAQILCDQWVAASGVLSTRYQLGDIKSEYDLHRYASNPKSSTMHRMSRMSGREAIPALEALAEATPHTRTCLGRSPAAQFRRQHPCFNQCTMPALFAFLSMFLQDEDVSDAARSFSSTVSSFT